MSQEKRTFKLEYKRSTSGTHVFVSQSDFPFTTTMYVRKDQMPLAPKVISVTVEYETTD